MIEIRVRSKNILYVVQVIGPSSVIDSPILEHQVDPQWYSSCSKRVDQSTQLTKKRTSSRSLTKKKSSRSNKKKNIK